MFIITTYHVLDPILGAVVPLYFVLKVAFVFWMVVPNSRGASLLFIRFVEPRMERVEREVKRWRREVLRGGGYGLSWDEEHS